MDCAETAVKLKIYAKKYIETFEENTMDKIGAEALRKKKLHKESANHSTNNILLDVFATVDYDQRCKQSHLSLTLPSASADTNVTISQDMLSQT
ncbi:unnamed protein product [Cercopithifilaria johnstoni]|uniref:Uncharacterized protein n=1 Tax=Cercopithifilaria johnstoni TaxID=2874296 RepID=A0A8J2MGI8_9BILA|nr:unnamed protein product [Cercopithifilaria johnstoni]